MRIHKFQGKYYYCFTRRIFINSVYRGAEARAGNIRAETRRKIKDQVVAGRSIVREIKNEGVVGPRALLPGVTVLVSRSSRGY